MSELHLCSLYDLWHKWLKYSNVSGNLIRNSSQIARFIWPTWGPSGADRTQVGPMLAPWTLLSRMSMLFMLNNKPYDTRGGPLLFQSHIEIIKHGINSFVYQGTKQWYSLTTDAKGNESFNLFKNYLTPWMGSDCHRGYCVLCAIKTIKIILFLVIVLCVYGKCLRLYGHTCI